MKRFYCYIVSVLLLVTIFSSCTNKKSGLSSRDRKEIMQLVSDTKRRLPLELDRGYLTITDIELEGDTLVYTCSADQILVDPILELSPQYISSDRTILLMVSNMDDATHFLMDKHLGLKYRFVNAETGELACEICLSHSQLKDIYEKVRSGQIEPYSYLEGMKLRFENLELPVQMGVGALLTKAYVEVANIYYVCELSEVEGGDKDMKKEEFDRMVEQTKRETIEELTKDASVTIYKDDIVENNTHFIYTYTNHEGKALFTIEISPHDLFPYLSK